MINWIIEEGGFNKELITHHGNKYLIGNGYMGIRGTLEEYEKDEFPAVNLAGIYDQVGNGWREPLNASNGLFTRVSFNGESCLLPNKLPVKHKVP
jgi:kojibiose phosphorylase/nigerose phosphorylase